MATYSQAIRANLLAELGRKDIKQQTAAAWFPVSPSAFSAKLYGKSDFKVGELMKLAIHLQVPFTTLVAGLDELVQEEIDSIDKAVAS